jgi:hypothetical protein
MNFSLPLKCNSENGELCTEDGGDVMIRPLAPVSAAASSTASTSHCNLDDAATASSNDQAGT